MLLTLMFYFLAGYAATHLLALFLQVVVGLWDIFISVSGIEDRRWKRRHKTAMAMRAEREAEQNRRWEAAQKTVQEQPAA